MLGNLDLQISLSLQKECFDHALALDKDLAAVGERVPMLELKTIIKALFRVPLWRSHRYSNLLEMAFEIFGDLNVPTDPSRVHSRGHIDRVAPNVVQ